MRDFHFSELYGPFKCEYDDCEEQTFMIRLTNDENKQLPEQSGPVAVRYIFSNNLGIALCEHHANIS